jgi:hypothetical protein
VCHPNAEQVAAAAVFVLQVAAMDFVVAAQQVYAAAVSAQQVDSYLAYAAAVSDTVASDEAVYAAAVSDSDSPSGDNVAADANGDGDNAWFDDGNKL